MNNKIDRLKELIQTSNNIVFFGGAGVSTESGIPDFRSKDGLYHQKYKFPPEEILSHSFFVNYPKDFYDFYKDKMNSLKFEPNITHFKLAELLELHGSVLRNYCMNCHKFYDASYIFNSKDIPYCSCGGIIKPDVVLYEESLNDDILSNAIYYISHADLLIIGGTSLTVYPAAGLIYYFHGKNIVLINRDTTELDKKANLVINDSLGNVFSKI